MRRSAWTLGVALLAALSLGVAACGSSSGTGSGGTKGSAKPATTPPAQAKQGGKLTVLWSGDVDHIDCGQTYYQMGNFICNATQKQLYAYKPDDSTTLVPDLADGPPQVSDDGKTVTVKIKSGVKYSPPYQDKTVTAADIKYAIERGFFNTVGAGFTQSYFGDLDGAKVGSKPGSTIKGVTTPDDNTVVMKFKRPVGGMIVSGALATPATAPVPEAYAAKYDKQNPST